MYALLSVFTSQCIKADNKDVTNSNTYKTDAQSAEVPQYVKQMHAIHKGKCYRVTEEKGK